MFGARAIQRGAILVTAIAMASAALPSVAPSQAGASTLTQVSSSTLAQALSPCPSNSHESSVPLGRSGEPRCIAGVTMNTRSRIDADCLLDPEARTPGFIYDEQQCGGVGSAAELIAQMRAIARLNDVIDSRSSTGISPDIQWEFGLGSGGGRGDILYYNSKDGQPANAQIYEVKILGVASYPGVGVQLGGYLRAFPSGAAAGTVLSTKGIALDTFRISRAKCPVVSDRIIDTYVTYPHPSVPGVLTVEKVASTTCGSPTPVPVPKGQPDEEPRNHVPYPIVTVRPGDGGDDEMPPTGTNVVEDFWMWERELQETLTSALCSWVCITPEELLYFAQATAMTVGMQVSENVRMFWGQSRAFTEQLIADIQWLMEGVAYGDPHLVSLDGLSYDFQAAGEFDLLQVPDFNFNVQARFQPPSSSASYSLFKALAVEVADHKVQIDGNSVRVDGDVVEVDDGGYIYLGNGAAVLKSGATYVIFGEGQKRRPVVQFKTTTGALSAYVPDGVSTRGLLGNNDKIRSNDLRLADGTQLSDSASPTTLHTTFANSWRIDANSSLFTYVPGEGPETFVDYSFPSTLLTLDDFSDLERADAERTCRDAGVVEGVPLRSCVYDLLSTQSQDYLASAVAASPSSSTGSDATLDSNGTVEVDFEGPVATNFDPRKIGDDAATTKFAGPFLDSEAYGFSLVDLDPHLTASTDLDLIVIGDWSRASDHERVSVKVNESEVWHADITGGAVNGIPASADLPAPKSSGTLASGLPYWVFPVSVDVPHHDSTFRATVAFSQAVGATRHNFGIDNINLHLDVVPPDVFTIDPISASAPVANSVPGSGAGNLEQNVSQDIYKFTVPAGGRSIALDNKTCVSVPGYVYERWSLQRSDGAVVASGVCSSDGTFADLSAGEYKLIIDTDGQKTGTYSFDLFTVPDAQSFGLSPSLGSAASVSDGSPGAGAGNIETIASKDIYNFTVPTGGQTLFLDNKTCVSTPGFAYSSWRVLDSEGAQTASGNCSSDKQLDNLSAGDYRIEITTSQIAGKYSFDLFVVDDPQSFDVAVSSTPFSVANGAPGTGAGNLETRFSKDLYKITVPSGGQSIVLDNITCVSIPGFTYQQWRLLNANGLAVSSGNCNTDGRFENLAAGQYTLEMTGDGHTGTYSFDLFTVPNPQSFVLTPSTGSPASVSNGNPAAGAGNLETVASKDIYNFTVPAGGSTMYLDNTACVSVPGFAYSTWTVKTEYGYAIASGSCSNDKQLDNLPAGNYRIEMTTTHIGGTYAFDLYRVDAPQTFDVTVSATPFSVADGAPAAGAGNLETRFSKDVYRFTVPTGGQSIALDNKTCVSVPGYTYQVWALINSQGTTVSSGNCNTDPQFTNLSADDYRLEVTAQGHTGTYSFDLFNVPDPQSFDLTPSAGSPSSVSDAVPSAGAGNLETIASKDVYRFTVPSGGQTMFLDNKTCVSIPGRSYSSWRLLNSSDATVATNNCANDQQFNNLPAGDYRLEMTTSERTGAYSFDLFVVDDPQSFDLTLSSVPFSVLNGTPSSGAGNLETRFSKDVYRFTVPTGGQSIALDNKTCISVPGYTYQVWKLLNSQGTTLSSGNCNTDKQFTNLPADAYRLEVTADGHTGPYTFDMSVL